MTVPPFYARYSSDNQSAVSIEDQFLTHSCAAIAEGYEQGFVTSNHG